MRLSQDKIKQGIHHTDQAVREAAALHFAVAYTEDRSVMPLVIQAIDTYGHEAAFRDLEPFQILPQSDKTIAWLVQEIAARGKASDRSTWEYVLDLSWILAEADARLLKRHRKEILGIRYLDAEARESIQQRTRLLSMSPQQCWLDFEHCCDQLADRQENDPRTSLLVHAYQLLEVVAHHSSDFAARVLASLDAETTERRDVAAVWKQVCCIQAAGQMRLVEAIPRLITILQTAQEEWVCDDCLTALVRIGGDPVVKAIWNACAVEPEEFYADAAWVLECVHSDLAAEAALHLLQQTNDIELKIALAHALLSDFSIDGLGLVRQLILSHPGADGMATLRDSFVAVSTLMEAELPELDSWKEQAEQEQAFLDQWQSPEFPVVDTWSEQLDKTNRNQAKEAPIPLQFPKKPRYQGVGRNDPCPCNSGKKHKHCCLRR